MKQKLYFLFTLFWYSILSFGQTTTINVTENGSLTIPCNVNAITVKVWGGSGYGGVINSGGGGSYNTTTYSVIRGAVYNYTAIIGQGGSDSVFNERTSSITISSLGTLTAYGGNGFNFDSSGLSQIGGSGGSGVDPGGNGAAGKIEISYTVSTPLSEPTVTTPVVRNQGDTAPTLTATIGANGTGLLWYTTATGGTGSATAPTPSTATVGNTSYWVSSTNANGCESERIKIDVIVTLNGQSASGLKFDGINDYIDCGNAITASLATANKFTFETWVKTNNVSTGQLIFGNHSTENAGANQASLRIINDRYEILLGHGNYSLMTPPGSVIANTWQHVAASWDGTNLKIFINGVLSNSLVISSYNLSNTNEKMYFGKNVYNDIFSGMIDETRIWNIALTDTEIQNSYNCEIANQAGLIAYYRFNQGTSGVDNTALTTLTDLTTNTNNGTLYNFNLTGYNSNWTAFDGSPLAPISYNQTFCSSTNPTVANLQVSGNGGGTFNWYDSASGGTPLATSTSLTTGTYYVSKVNGSCENSRFSINVIVSNVSEPTVTTPVVRNQGDTAPTLTATIGANGTGLLWYTTATGGTGSATAPAPSTATVGNTSYWVSSTNANGCESARTEIVVTVNVAAPTTTFATQVNTGDDKDLTDLQVTGSSITWYQAATGGLALPTTTLLVDETTYYASQTIASVESTERLAITVNRISDNTQTFCAPATVANLVSTPSSGTTAQWYETATGGTALASTTALVTGTYYASQTVNGSESTRTALSITVNTTAVPTAISPQVYAGTGTIANLTATGTNLQWYAAATGGTALVSTEALVDGTTYYVSQTGTCGESTRTAVTVRKISEATQTLCAPATVANLVSTPSTGATAQWFTTASGGTALPSTDVLTNGVYYVEQNTPTTTVSTFAGSGTDSETDGTGTAASFNNPRGLAVDVSGNVYVADFGNHKIRKITPAGVVSTLAGSGDAGATDGTGTAASFNYPTGVVVDASGNVHVADFLNQKIRKITPAGVVSTLAGSGTRGATDGTGTAASFYNPYGVTVDASGNVYVADFYNHKIRKITPAGVVSTLAGYGTQGATDGTGTAASFNYPSGVTVDASGNVHVADTNNHKIRKITPAGVVSTLAGSGDAGATDGTGTAASFFNPYGVTVDASGNVYVADKNNNKIRKITPAGEVSTLAGSGTRGATDGTGTAASFYNPNGVTVDASGNVYVADFDNHKIRKITQSSTSNRVAVNVTVNPIPSAPTVLSTQVYAGTGTIANLTATGTNLQWYAAATGGTALASTDALVDGTTYYVSQTGTCGESTRTAVTVRKISEATQTLCEPATVANLVSTPSTGATAQWFTTASGGTALVSTDALTTGTYYVEQTTPESTSNRVAVSITVNTTAVPIVTTPVVYNQGDAATALTATGANLLWYTAATGGTGSATAPAPSTATVGNTSYWVSSTNANGCESARTEIVVTVNVAAPTTTFATQVYTGDDKDLTDLQVTGSSITWYQAATGGLALPTTTLLVDETTYYASQTIASVESTERLAITVNRISDNTQMLPAASTVANLVATPSTGATAQWFTAATGGTALPSTDVLTNGVYYVEQNTPSSTVTLGSGFYGPSDVAIQADGKIVVADTGNNAIKRITESLSSNRVPVNVDVTTLSVSNFETNGIAIYPNPSTGIFNISAQENVTIEVYNLVGKQIKTQEVPVGTSTIDISNYASGVYLLKATNTKGGVNNYKLIKQ